VDQLEGKDKYKPLNQSISQTFKARRERRTIAGANI